MSSGQHRVRLEGSKSNAKRRNRYSSGSSDSKGSTGDSSSSSHKNKKKRRYQNHSRDEFKNLRFHRFSTSLNIGSDTMLNFMNHISTRQNESYLKRSMQWNYQINVN